MTTRIRNGDSASYGRDVTCPRCNAGRGEPCHNARGDRTVVHWQRVRKNLGNSGFNCPRV